MGIRNYQDKFRQMVEWSNEKKEYAPNEELLNYLAEVWNGGHEQWLDHKHDHAVVPELLSNIGSESGHAVAKMALRHRRNTSTLCDLDTMVYDGMDTMIVESMWEDCVRRMVIPGEPGS